MRGQMSFTLREMTGRLRSSKLMWHLLGYFMALMAMVVSGPFGTFNALSLGGRLLYWAIAMGVPWLLLAVSLEILMQRQGQVWWRLAVVILVANALVAVIIMVVVVGLESLLLLHRFDDVSLISLYLYVFMIGLILTVIAAMLRFPRYLAAPTKYADEGAPPPIDSALEDLFFEKIPLRLGRDLVHLKMQDHYLEVVTDAGQCLVLMRMSDAVAALPEQLGGQVHRSHWIAWGHVDKAINRAGRKFLLLKNGIEVPVSRRFQKVVRARFG